MHNLVLDHSEYMVLQDIGRLWLLTARWVQGDKSLSQLSNYTKWIATPIRWRPALNLEVRQFLAPFMNRCGQLPGFVTTDIRDGHYWVNVPHEYDPDIAEWANVLESVMDMGIIPPKRQTFAQRLLGKLRAEASSPVTEPRE